MGKQGLFKSTVMFFLVALLAGCGVMPSATTLAVAECQNSPNTPTPNLYDIDLEDWVIDIYNYAQLADVTLPGQKFREARHAAFKVLGHQAQRWSDFVDVKLSDADVVRITITYLSPQLIETILLNDLLQNHDIMDPPELFKANMLKRLTRTRNRSEVLFLITITSTRYKSGPNGEPVISVHIPLKSLILTNSSNQNANTKRGDNSIDQFIQLAHGPVSGIIGYQMTVKNGNNCSYLLDPQVNNTISIHLEELEINGIKRDPQTWTIRYQSLLGVDGLDVKPQYVDINPIPEHWIPSSDAPQPVVDIPVTITEVWNPYWEAMGRYLWEQVTFANSP
jgi:hypothetical protein